MIHQNQKYLYVVIVIHNLFHFVSSKIENDSEIRKIFVQISILHFLQIICNQIRQNLYLYGVFGC